jgi:phenylpropionate dioxygenase-like ring-hydroxylating dioxygenase large terminal subunit
LDPETTEYLREQINAEFRRFEAKAPPPGGFEPLPDIPTGRYIDDEFFALEQAHIWSKSWLLAAHQDELPERGSYLLWQNSGVPILIVRGRDDEIRAFYNSCPHRGGPVVREASGKAVSFVCKYHCWAFDLDGSLKGIPDAHEFGDIDRSRRGLKPIRCEAFGNLIYVNRDPDAAPLGEFLGAMTHELADFCPDELRLVHKYTFELPVNWKITMDAFQEVYHLKHIHPDTVDQRIDHRGASMALFPNGHSRMMVPAKTGRAEFVSQPAQQPLEDDPRQEMTRSGSLSYNMFPNLVTPTGAVSFPFLLFWPIARDRTLFEVIWYTRGEDADKNSSAWKGVLAAFDVILGEDNENLPWIQRSVESGAMRGIPLSYQERRIYHFHEYVDRVIGAEKIPARLRVTPRLTKLEENGRGQLLA